MAAAAQHLRFLTFTYSRAHHHTFLSLSRLANFGLEEESSILIMSQSAGSDAESVEHVSEEEVLAVDELSDAESVYEDIVPQQKVEIDNKASAASTGFVNTHLSPFRLRLNGYETPSNCPRRFHGQRRWP